MAHSRKTPWARKSWSSARLPAGGLPEKSPGQHL